MKLVQIRKIVLEVLKIVSLGELFLAKVGVQVKLTSRLDSKRPVASEHRLSSQ